MSLSRSALSVAGRLTDALVDTFGSGPGVDPRELQPVGWFRHGEAVDRLLESFRAVPAGSRVRLAKRTSNLFRARANGDVPGLDVSGLGGVIAVDPVERTADVQGMCTYEDLVDTVLPHGLAPYVVPELKTITLGGAVTGMGVESTSFRNGLPHESVLEMDILTGTGEIVTCSPERNVDLYRGFPNSYGSLGYAVRLKIRLEPVEPYVALRHVRFSDVTELTAALERIVVEKSWDGERVDYLDGVVFSLDEAYLVLGTQTSEPGPVSDYTRDRIYYRSIQHPEGVSRDRLTIRDYLWRWDIDWFWCSRAFGTQDPTLRTLWPRPLLRSSFYWKIVGWDRRYDLADRIEARAGRPARERVVQDIEVTPDRLPEFLTWFFTASEIQPVWLCPIRLSDDAARLTGRGEVLDDATARADGSGDHPWPLYPLTPETTWVNVGFWSSVPVDLMGPEAPPGAFNREVERVVNSLGGHKSLYSEAFYPRDVFEGLYGGGIPGLLKKTFDPEGRFPGLYEKTVGGA
ncbi:FAD-binding oxidoreductase [Corynebacterium bovis]|uniref:Delta(24)-sterol reductase n=1 Tax=Corynebacterium bovis TaxID=36808 RepID=A0A426Q5M7_9CORY|nr:FAD-binding oxidoreductase [Corynebacterium bovis]RRO91444.1 dehydrogenase [Corynebacterium bovis]RRO98576.1 dehydrogenase [Corynebacterium bovis]RRQ00353.1 dehydrogenase [Corynebacterium bovis]RRQ00867.1 dehydrogenase [Corynebacterium bovis]RRQ03875.1 dehydrogenase [Corynebacterium bovis]